MGLASTRRDLVMCVTITSVHELSYDEKWELKSENNLTNQLVLKQDRVLVKHIWADQN